MCMAPPGFSRSARSKQWQRRKGLIRFILFAAFIGTCAVLVLIRIGSCYVSWIYFKRYPCAGNAMKDWESHSIAERHNTGSRVNVAIAVISDNFLGSHLRSLLLDNKRRYAEKWGYGFIAPTAAEAFQMAGGLPTPWAKFVLLQKAFKQFEYVLMVDADTVFLRFDIGLLGMIRALGNRSILISADLNGPNSGVFMMRNTPVSRIFVKEALKAAKSLSKNTSVLPLQFENRALLYLLDMWPRCFSLTRVDAWFAPVSRMAVFFRPHVATIDRCLINRRAPRANGVTSFLDSGAAFDNLQNAYIVHTAGGGLDSKKEALYKLLQLAQDGIV